MASELDEAALAEAMETAKAALAAPEILPGDAQMLATMVLVLAPALRAARQRIAALEDAATIYGAVMVQADGLEADLRARIAELEGERDAWRAFAEHQELCSTCGEDGVRKCYDGRTLQDAALRAAAGGGE